MNKYQYREQFESQVKDLIDGYRQTHGEAPAVTIEWGKVAPEPEVKYEHRPDCAEFEPKRHDNHCGDCQTDGHYLCGGCRHIAPFEQMEESDNAMRYYPEQEKQRIAEEKRLLELSDADEESAPEVVPPDNIRDVLVTMSDGRELKGWYNGSWWYIIYPNSEDMAVGYMIAPDDIITGWKEIE